MVLPYMVLHGSHQYTPVMLAYIPAPWILWVSQMFFDTRPGYDVHSSPWDFDGPFIEIDGLPN